MRWEFVSEFIDLLLEVGRDLLRESHLSSAVKCALVAIITRYAYPVESGSDEEPLRTRVCHNLGVWRRSRFIEGACNRAQFPSDFEASLLEGIYRFVADNVQNHIS